MRNRFDLAIFDLDGTLLDSLEDIAQAANHVLVEIGGAARPISDFRTLVGDGVRVLFQRAVPETTVNDELRDRCMDLFDRFYGETWHNHSKPYKGIRDLLISLDSAGVSLAVLSNKPDPFTQKCVSHFFPEIRFQAVLGHSERFPRKPDPASARWIGESAGICSDRIAYVGDTNTDMKTAVSAGFFAMGVTWGFRTERELIESGADAVYSTPSVLLAAIIGRDPLKIV